MKLRYRRGVLGLGILASASAIALTAAAQTTTSGSPDEPAEVEQIVVTGSRIRQPNLTSISPLTSIGKDEIAKQGVTNVETMLNSLPQVTSGYTSATSNGATGTASVDLRGLGAARTLVLMDGRRLVPGDPTFPVADLNTVPAALVERVDVVTGGASAVYGSDAVAGVVNFIMKHDLEGVKLNASVSFNNHHNNDSAERALLDSSGYTKPDEWVNDGFVYDYNIAAGFNTPDDKGNLTVFGGYRQSSAVTQDSRDYSACSISNAGTTPACVGSSNAATGFFNIGGTRYTTTSSGTFRAYTSADAFNFGPYNYLQRSDKRYTLGEFAHYEVNPKADVYLDTTFVEDKTTAQIAPAGLWRGTEYTINCDNPLMSAQQKGILCGSTTSTDSVTMSDLGYRLTAGGPRQYTLKHRSYRGTLGVRGDLNDAWSYDNYIQYSRAEFAQRTVGEYSTARINNALQVVNVNGVATCKSVVDGTDPSCVPLDIFTVGNVSDAALAYIGAVSTTGGSTTESIASGSLSGDLTEYGVKSPWASQGVGVALGAEYRRQTLNYTADEVAQEAGTVPVKGAFNVGEVFGELRAPLLSDKPFVKALDFETGYRWSNYSTAGETQSYKFGLTWSPDDQVRVRASYNRAVRAPNILELYTPQGIGLFGGSDPCAGTSPTATLAQCQATGVTAAQYGTGVISECPSSQCNELYGGNEELKPEKADTKSIGVVLTPAFLPRFSLSLDWYDIKVTDVIGGISPTVILSQCLTTGADYFCKLIHRSSSGSLIGTDGYIVSTNLNTGYLWTSGVDINANYSVELPAMGGREWGGLKFELTGGYRDKYRTEPLPGLGSYDCKGLYGPTCGLPQPAWRHNFRTTWETPWKDVELSLAWRYIGGSKLDMNTSDPFLTGGDGFYDALDAKIEAYNYFDLTTSFKVKGNTVRVGVNNLFDKDPPVLDSSGYGVSSAPYGNANTYPGMYDSLGRHVFIALSADF